MQIDESTHLRQENIFQISYRFSEHVQPLSFDILALVLQIAIQFNEHAA